ncbi:Protein of unknown function [Gryllus bimaculatus]|nr:Protein of unknown function [Gryllus bimaculatus]
MVHFKSHSHFLC